MAMAEFTLPNVRHLYAVQEVAESNRINVAADRVHLSQPAVTQAVGKLEQALAVRLFDRRPEGMYPTEVGELYLHRVTRALGYLKDGERQARKRAPKQGAQGRRDFHRLTTAVQLKALTAVARTGNFSHAARLLGVSQPAVRPKVCTGDVIRSTSSKAGRISDRSSFSRSHRPGFRDRHQSALPMPVTVVSELLFTGLGHLIQGQ